MRTSSVSTKGPMNVPKFSGVYPVTVARADMRSLDELGKRVNLGLIASQETGAEFMSVATIDGPEFYWLQDDDRGFHAKQYNQASSDAIKMVTEAMSQKYPNIQPEGYSFEQELEEEALYDKIMRPIVNYLKEEVGNQRISFLVTHPNKRPVDFVRLDYTV